MKNLLLTGIALGLCTSGCSEQTPETTRSDNPITQSTTLHTSHSGPLVISLDEIDDIQDEEVFVIDDESAVIINDGNGDFDSATVKNNQSIKSRAGGSITPLASGVSLLTQRVDYDVALQEVLRYRVYEYDAAGLRTQRIRYNTAGLDGIWLNADDDIQDYSVYDALMTDVQTLLIRYNAAGPDGTWLNADDIVQYYDAELLDAAGLPVGTARYNDLGLDGAWFTADDIIQNLTVETIAADGSTQEVQYTDPGADLDWTTLDDNTVGRFSAMEVNVDGLNVRHIMFTDAGLDLIPFTADDTPLVYHTYTYNSASLRTNRLQYNGPGIDMEWFTADDDIDFCQETAFTATSNIDHEIRTSVGTDNLCFTGDDLTIRHEMRMYDDTDHLLTRHRFGDPGADMLWFTADDVLSREYTYTPTP